MGMPQISSDWKPSYVMAMGELNPARLKLFLDDAEAAMFVRYEEIADSPHHEEEKIQMANALEDLRVVKIHLLGWSAGSPRRAAAGL
jgi:hypothetical protein